MQTKLALVFAALATLAAATEPASQCNTAPVQCCNSVQPAGSKAASSLLATVGVVIQDLTVPIGITCSPISVIGVGGDSCSANPVCCEDNSFHGLVAIGCVPVDLSL
ncbi:fungal hydrophobin [Dendrothele bispora CBS 962.96]|uniref:Hydrophobin n=1 Tax=Dendrothele bispora (strain CBS 962.96) TaxID=1314807 RepID=A0A4S8MYV5_DENBC|nr:fungal hydrophobin [Dendrothele bispora CBS 962.96]